MTPLDNAIAICACCRNACGSSM